MLQPFLAAVIFAAILCFSTWPIYIRLRQRVGGRSWLAALLLVGIMLLVIALPVALCAQSIVAHSGQVVELLRGVIDHRSNFELPAFIQNIPTLGTLAR